MRGKNEFDLPRAIQAKMQTMSWFDMSHSNIELVCAILNTNSMLKDKLLEPRSISNKVELLSTANLDLLGPSFADMARVNWHQWQSTDQSLQPYARGLGKLSSLICSCGY